jgi:anthranilate/para-aminobenzoate synthase component II
LKSVKVVGQNLPISWVHPTAAKVREESRTFSGFSPELIDRMSNEPVAIHFHSWSVLESDYLAIDSLNAFFKLISVNTNAEGVRYITGFEAFKYPIFSVIYHPEY